MHMQHDVRKRIRELSALELGAVVRRDLGTRHLSDVVIETYLTRAALEYFEPNTVANAVQNVADCDVAATLGARVRLITAALKDEFELSPELVAWRVWAERQADVAGVIDAAFMKGDKLRARLDRNRDDWRAFAVGMSRQGISPARAALPRPFEDGLNDVELRAAGLEHELGYVNSLHSERGVLVDRCQAWIDWARRVLGRTRKYAAADDTVLRTALEERARTRTRTRPSPAVRADPRVTPPLAPGCRVVVVPRVQGTLGTLAGQTGVLVAFTATAAGYATVAFDDSAMMSVEYDGPRLRICDLQHEVLP